MASVLVFSRPSNNHLSALQQNNQPERGDIVDISARDDFHWGNAIMGPARLGWWQVVIVPNAGMRELGGYLERVRSELHGWAVWRHRLWTVDLDAIGAGQSEELWTVPLERFRAAATRKPLGESVGQLVVA